jgi:hypothetical protein
MKRLRTWKLFQIFSTEIKKSKTYGGWCPFQGLSNGTTLKLAYILKYMDMYISFYEKRE